MKKAKTSARDRVCRMRVLRQRAGSGPDGARLKIVRQMR